MATKLSFKYKEKKYVLEYTRESMVRMEAEGFVGIELMTKPATMVPILIRGAFYAHNPDITQEEVDDIFKNIKNKLELTQRLEKMASETIESLYDEPENEGNIIWGVVE